MAHYNNIIDQLLRECSLSMSENKYFLSIYVATHHETKLEINHFLKSFLLENIKKHIFFENTDLFHLIFPHVEKYVESLQRIPQGLAFFISLKIDTKFPEMNMESVMLNSKPDNEFYIGKTYKLDQFAWLNCFSPDTLLVHLSRKSADLFYLDEHIMTQVLQEKNISINEVLSSDAETGKTERAEDHENTEFLRLVFDRMLEVFNSGKKINYLVIFYSDAFRNILHHFIEKNISRLSPFEFHTILLNQNITQEQQLEQRVREHVKKFYKAQIRKLVIHAQNQKNHYTEGWKQIAQASLLGNIDTLFVKGTSKSMKGYLSQNEFVSLEPIDNAVQVDNILPWIINRIIKTNGKIILLKKTSPIKGTYPFATLRYEITH